MSLKTLFYTFLLSLTPVIELRGSIPMGKKLGLSIYEATTISIFGGICIALTLPWLLPRIFRFFEKHIKVFHRLMDRVFEKTRVKHSEKMELVGDLALITIVAVPLPGTGAWTGSMLAYLFGVPYKRAIWLISLGVIISGITVAILTFFGGQIWRWFIGFF